MRGQTLLSDRESRLFDTSRFSEQRKGQSTGDSKSLQTKNSVGQLREGEPGVPPDMADRMMRSNSSSLLTE
jgi:hypothetical protein